MSWNVVHRHHGVPALRTLARGASSLTLIAATPCLAQQVPASSSAPVSVPATDQDGVEQANDDVDIVVTGIRGSIDSATTAKRDSVAFSDSIFAEDIGKLPATNLAEALNRIPGVRLSRDITGDGNQVNIRGLGSQFSQILLNGARIAIASDGTVPNVAQPGRAVDLQAFPSELFTRLDISKSPVPSGLEGGIAGTVNLRAARPFDNPGTHLSVIGQGQYSDSNRRVSPRGAVIASRTFADTFGVLFGVSAYSIKTRVDSYQTTGFTDANLPACPRASACRSSLDTGDGFTFASIVPANTGNGFSTGAVVDPVATSGLTASQLSNAKLPRLAGQYPYVGTRDRIAALAAIEWRPSGDLKTGVDAFYVYQKGSFLNYVSQWQVRNTGPGTTPTSTGGMIPVNLTIDDNGFVSSGRFLNSSVIVQVVPAVLTTRFWSVNPYVTWQPADKLQIDLKANYSASRFNREQPTFVIQTPPLSGLVVDFDNGSNRQIPQISTNQNLNDPNLGWRWYRANTLDNYRVFKNKGLHLDLSYGDEQFTLRSGLAYDDQGRTFTSYDNTAAFTTAVCGAGCAGGPGSLVPNSQLAGFLLPFPISDLNHLGPRDFGYSSFVTADVDALKEATNYSVFRKNSPTSASAPPAKVRERVFGGYLQIDGERDILARPLRLIAGARFTHAEQRVTAASNTVTNGVNGLVYSSAAKSYDDVLPSIAATYDLLRQVKLRAAISRTLTRPEPNQLLPQVTFGDTSAQTATSGNPDLNPYRSTNIDLGGEIYTSRSGYVGLAYFNKSIEGFTVNQQITQTFGSLGISADLLGPTILQALSSRSALTNTPIANLPIAVARPVNLQDLKVQGFEATWVQPLDFLVRGSGFTANGTRTTQSSSGPLVATGISPWTYSLQAYYEGHGASVSLNYTWQDRAIANNGPQNSINLPSYLDSRGQLDLSASYQLPFANKAIRLTVDALNITNAPLRTAFGYSNETESAYWPGRQILVGFRVGI